MKQLEMRCSALEKPTTNKTPIYMTDELPSIEERNRQFESTRLEEVKLREFFDKYLDLCSEYGIHGIADFSDDNFWRWECYVSPEVMNWVDKDSIKELLIKKFAAELDESFDEYESREKASE